MLGTLSACSPLKAEARPRPKPWQREAWIDYSAANEYMTAHYSQLHNNGKQHYFEHTLSSSSTLDGKEIEEIYNARNGYFYDDCGELVEPLLEQCGFQLVNMKQNEATLHESVVTDWTDMDQITKKFLPRLRTMIEDTLAGQGCPSSSTISHILFYQPMLRGENDDMGPKTSPVASLVHIDTDFGAHDVEGIVRMVERNQIRSTSCSSDREEKYFPRNELMDAIRDGRRFTIINAWRGANADGLPVERAHLGLLSPRYRCDDGASLPRRHRCYPALRPDRSQSRWYAYPQLTKDEVLLFKQYDRRVDRVSDIWHCSLPAFPGEERCSPRTSFDCRALIVFEDVVPAELDRYCNDRSRPVLSLEESGCFCDSQAEERESLDK